MIDSLSLVLFGSALVVSAGVPGPSIAALVSRVIIGHWTEVLPFLAAMWLGEILWMTLAIAGLAAIAETFHVLFLIVKYCGVLYLLYLAWQMWSAPTSFAEDRRPGDVLSAARMFLTGLSITMGNPKIMVFYLALLPTIIDVTALSFVGWAGLAGIMLAVLMVIDGAYVLLAHHMRMLIRTPRAVRLANRIGAVSLGGAATIIASR